MDFSKLLIEIIIPLLVPLSTPIIVWILSHNRGTAEVEHIKSQTQKEQSQTSQIATDAANKAVILWQGLYSEQSKLSDEREARLGTANRELEQRLIKLEVDVAKLKEDKTRLRLVISTYIDVIMFLLREITNAEVYQRALTLLRVDDISDLIEERMKYAETTDQ